jgi:signal transduction histidine kinase
MPGNGLGLSLVAAVARLHDAKIKLFPNRPGLTIELQFPPSPPHMSAQN